MVLHYSITVDHHGQIKVSGRTKTGCQAFLFYTYILCCNDCSKVSGHRNFHCTARFVFINGRNSNLGASNSDQLFNIYRGRQRTDLAGIKQNRKTYRTFCEDKLVTTFKMGRDNVKAKEKKKERKMMEQKMNAG